VTKFWYLLCSSSVGLRDVMCWIWWPVAGGRWILCRGYEFMSWNEDVLFQYGC